ncbi:Gamma-aminobutyric acid type B receptor subunit 2 (GABA-B receptor 2) (GABA-B-R2) (GABA-BR2) (GABABR2) (Gb2) (G-protein coupled receptor 51) (HG20), partial [Durusdinium trenchii]
LKDCFLSEPEDTAHPTVSPTRAPSATPSAAPTTAEPTRSPSAAPTTPGPTDSPTETVTEPTEEPTTPQPTTPQPTESPVVGPTTPSPSRAPSSSPTKAPSTMSPTGSPTIDTVLFCKLITEQSECAGFTFCVWTKTNDVESCKATSQVRPENEPEDDGGLEWVSVVATLIAILGLLAAVASLLFVHVHQTKPVMVLGGVKFLKLLCVGAMLLNIGVFFYAFPPKSTGLCVVRKWWFDLAFVFTFSILLVKMWRVWRLVYAEKRVEDHAMFRMMAGLFLVYVFLLVLWAAADPPDAVYDPVEDLYSCDSGTTGFVFLVISYVFMAGLIVAAIVLAASVYVLGSLIGESKQILFVVNNVVVFGILNAIIAGSGYAEDVMGVLVFAFSVFWCTSLGLAVLLWSKYEKLGMTKQELQEIARQKMATSSGGPSSQGSPPDTYNTATSGNTGLAEQVEMKKVGPAGVDRQRMFRHGSDTFSGRLAKTDDEFYNFFPSKSYTENAGAIHMADLDGPATGGTSFNGSRTEEVAPVRLPPRPNVLERASSARSVGSRSRSPHSAQSSKSPGSGYTDAQRYSFPHLDSLSSGRDTPSSFKSSLDNDAPTPGDNADKSSSAATDGSNASAVVIANGFKIGQVGDWEEYVHRETGESFWVSIETGAISNKAPGDVTIV